MTRRPEVIHQLRRAFCFVVLLFALPRGATPQGSQEQPYELARRIVQNELRIEAQDHSHWMFRLETERNNGRSNVDEVVETTHGDLKLPISIDGGELTPKQRRDWDKRLQQLVQNPEPIEKSRKDQNQDA